MGKMKKLLRKPVPLIVTGFVVSLFVFITLALVVGNVQIIHVTNCTNSDCSWEITNCCPENAGAQWSCVNKRTFAQAPCPSTVICPQVISPKPDRPCICIRGVCTA
jgi:hypothetical protein